MNGKRRLANLFSIHIAFAFTNFLLEVPLFRLFEQAICNRYYRTLSSPGTPIDEAECKIPEIQDFLAKVVGWKMSFDALPGETSLLAL